MSLEESTKAAGQLSWYKSSYSGSDGGDCIEVATTPGAVYVRDSKNVEGPMLLFSAEEWSAFVIFARESSPSNV